MVQRWKLFPRGRLSLIPNVRPKWSEVKWSEWSEMSSQTRPPGNSASNTNINSSNNNSNAYVKFCEYVSIWVLIDEKQFFFSFFFSKEFFVSSPAMVHDKGDANQLTCVQKSSVLVVFFFIKNEMVSSTQSSLAVIFTRPSVLQCWNTHVEHWPISWRNPPPFGCWGWCGRCWQWRWWWPWAWW